MSEEKLLAELLAAKDAHGADPSDANRKRKTKAAEKLRAHRAEARQGRTSLVGGDAYKSNGG